MCIEMSRDREKFIRSWWSEGKPRAHETGKITKSNVNDWSHGARTDRIELAKVLKRIEAGDLLIVTRLDRLARSTRDLLNILHQLAEKGAKFKSLHDPWCDTSTPQGELLVTVLAGFATFERHLIKARTDDGRKRAQARGVRFGRPRKLDADQRREALERLAKGDSLVDVARTFGVDPTTIGRLQ
jgi:DNA invertase Pin-like site-specific DNA recombinase